MKKCVESLHKLVGIVDGKISDRALAGTPSDAHGLY
jgi:hypothetical protein